VQSKKVEYNPYAWRKELSTALEQRDIAEKLTSSRDEAVPFE